MSYNAENGPFGALVLLLKILVVPVAYGLLLYAVFAWGHEDSTYLIAIVSAVSFAYLQIRLVGLEGTCWRLKDRLAEQNRAIERLEQADRRYHQ